MGPIINKLIEQSLGYCFNQLMFYVVKIFQKSNSTDLADTRIFCGVLMLTQEMISSFFPLDQCCNGLVI